MVIAYFTSRSIFTSFTTCSGRNIFGKSSPIYSSYMNIVPIKNGSGSDSGSGGDAIFNIKSCIPLSEGQHNIVQQIHDMYSVMLASRSYDKIPSNYEQFMDLIVDLKTIPISNSTLTLLLNIVEKTLIGCMNVVSIYENSMYNELQILLLNNQIDDILNNKNNKNVVADKDAISGQFTVQQTFKLSKFYSYYIYLYGLPDFGVGFDPKKLLFLKKSLELFDQTHIKVPDTLLIPDSSGSEIDIAPGVVPLVTPIQQSIFEIGYAVNIYDHLMEYNVKYPLGYFITAILDVALPPSVPISATINPDPTGILALSYYSELAGLGGLDSSGGLPVDACLNTIIYAGTPEQLKLTMANLDDVFQYLLTNMWNSRPIKSHTIIPPGGDVFTSTFASYMYYFSTETSIHNAFITTQQYYGGNVKYFSFHSYDLETSIFTIMDHCGNIFHTKSYEGIV